MNPDRLAELEDERRFLLQSLRDLEREHEAGDVDDGDYATLRDGYTSRAAGVLRSIEDGKASMPVVTRRSFGRRMLIVAAVAVVAIGVGWMVARWSGQRLPGQEISGGAPTGEVAGLLAEARLLAGTDQAAALAAYDQVLAERPEHVEALSYSGWLLVLSTPSLSEELREVALDQARNRLDRAVAADPDYPDAHCFRSIIAARIDDDVETARREGRRCLALDPPALVRGLMEPVLATLGE